MTFVIFYAPFTAAVEYTSSFSDGLWHTFSVVANQQMLNVTVDQNSKVSTRTLLLKAGSDYYIGKIQWLKVLHKNLDLGRSRIILKRGGKQYFGMQIKIGRGPDLHKPPPHPLLYTPILTITRDSYNGSKIQQA